jgi:hypothetical protein
MQYFVSFLSLFSMFKRITMEVNNMIQQRKEKKKKEGNGSSKDHNERRKVKVSKRE